MPLSNYSFSVEPLRQGFCHSRDSGSPMCDRSLDVVHGLPDQCRLVDVEAAAKPFQIHQIGNDKRLYVYIILYIYIYLLLLVQ